MKHILLQQGWLFRGMEPQSFDYDAVKMPNNESSEWRQIDVPGDINAALLKYGDVPDPHYDTQAQESYWITAKEWWYKNTFDVDKDAIESAELCLEGVDGHADVWLNGVFLGTMKNAFRLFRFDAASLLQEKENQLLVRFHSLDQFFEGPREGKLTGWPGKRCFIRKPQFNFGWDWALPLPSLGLAGNVWLELNHQRKLVDVAVTPHCNGRVDFEIEVSKAARDSGYTVDIELEGYGENLRHRIEGCIIAPYTGHGVTAESASKARYKSCCSLKIEDPRLWFPNGYGEQALYKFSVSLNVNAEVVDCYRGQVGLRESRIYEKPFVNGRENGFSFGIELNGEAIFCKGANWVPLELCPGTIKDEQYDFYLRKAKEANFNMIRVWGGGIYEHKRFYELCDELGIMVWQDFMFASGGYPVDYLRDEIIIEAEYQIKRLRNHSSIVLWCGCNEDVYSWSYPGENSGGAQEDDGVFNECNAENDKWSVDRLKDDPQIYSMILRGLTSRHGLGVPYIESSPQSRDDCGNIPSSGNSHISCWKYALLQSPDHPEEFREHFEQVCSFNSEFCIQGPCSENAIRKFMAQKNYWPPNASWTYHIQLGHRDIPHHEQTMLIAEGILGQIDSLATYVKYGQTVHLEMMRSEFESARRDRPDSGGTMVWMLNDCWPTANWSIIDYSRTPKPAYYAAKRSCEPLLPIIFSRGGKIEFFFANDTLSSQSVTVRYGQETLVGEKLWSKELELTVNANSTQMFDAIEHSKTEQMDSFLFIDATVSGKETDRIVFFPNGWKDINWPESQVKMECLEQRREDHKWKTTIKISADTFVRLCHISFPERKNEITFSDNYFDLCAQHEKRMIIHSSDKFDIAKLHVGHWLTAWR